MSLPTIESEKVLLRPFSPGDVAEVTRLASDKEIAKTTSNIPHPYEEKMAKKWIEKHEKEWEKGEALKLAVTRKEDENLVGSISLEIYDQHDMAELGYWIGKEYWSKGYCTEAAAAIIEYGFEVLDLNKIYASYFKDNPGSGKVLKKLGMRKEGCFRQHFKKWGEYKDQVYYGILKDEYLSNQ